MSWRDDVPRRERTRINAEIPDETAEILAKEATREGEPTWKLVHKCIQTTLGDASKLKHKKQRLEDRLNTLETEQEELQDELESIESQLDDAGPQPYEQALIEWAEWHIDSDVDVVNEYVKSVESLDETYDDYRTETIIRDLEQQVDSLKRGDDA